MKGKSAYLIINPRSDKIDKLTAMISVFSAAGWKTDTAIKEYGGHTRRLAKKAAEAGYDVVIGYGGDGTINQVVNGVIAANRRHCMLGVIPGGTANVWAHEIGLPEDAVKAALALIGSAGRKVDLGHVQVDAVPKSRRTKRPPLESGGRHHFLLMAGLGVDAAIMRDVSTPLKEKIGRAAVAVAAVAVAPSQHTFPIEIRASAAGKKNAVHWKGEALQVIVGNTRRYANIADVTPDAQIDDGVLDVCVITAGNPLSTMQQILSVLLHRDPVRGRSEYFQSAHVEISVPASIDLQIDGSAVRRKDYPTLDRATRKKGARALIMYRFDAMPRALHVAIPSTYGGPLFEAGAASAPHTGEARSNGAPDAVRSKTRRSGNGRTSAKDIKRLFECGRTVTVVGVGPKPDGHEAYVVAGEAPTTKTGNARPVAVRIDHTTALFTPTGKRLPTASVATLPDGAEIIVDGKESKRGVIRATSVVVVP